jgi:hypothetical protein
VAIERRRVRRLSALVIRDDGEGILPELSREEALRAIATNIGHSRKRGLSPRERHDQIVAGKYGIGLLGFWSVGHRMDIRSRVRRRRGVGPAHGRGPGAGRAAARSGWRWRRRTPSRRW